MFDSPIHDRYPGQPLRQGLPYHGLLEFPQLRTALECPISSVRLTTHGGRVLFPFVGMSGIVNRTALTHCTRLFRDPRAVDAPEEIGGHDWSGYVVISEQNDFGIMESASHIYHAGAFNHLCDIATSRVFAARVISRSVGSGGWESQFLDFGITRDVLDITPDGARILERNSQSSAAPLRLATLSGAYPGITCSVSDLLTTDQVSVDTETTTGVPQHLATPWLFGVIAACSGQWADQQTCGVLVTDRAPVGNESPASQFLLPYEYETTTTRRSLATAWLVATDTAACLWYRRRSRVHGVHDVDYGLDSQSVIPGPGPITEVGVLASWHRNTHDQSDATWSWALQDDSGAELSALEVNTTHEYMQERRWVQGDGIWDGDDDYVQTDTSTRTCQVELDGVDILGLFPAMDSPEFTYSGDFLTQTNFQVFDNAAPAGETRTVILTPSLYRYARNLVALRCVCRYERRVAGVLVEQMSRMVMGHAIYRGQVDDQTLVTADSTSRLYGSADPHTGKTARDYLHPVIWI